MNDKNLNMICRLSGFHTLMSLLDSIGRLVLSKLQPQFTHPTPSNSLLSEKANARAIRGHFLLDSALFYTLISELNKHSDLQHSFEIIMEDSTQIHDISYDTTQSVVSELKDKQKASRTARHWFHLWFNLSSDLVIEQVMMRPI